MKAGLATPITIASTTRGTRTAASRAESELWATVTPDTPHNLYGRWIAEVKGATAADDYRNGPNNYGWNVEIDPFNPTSTPKKRTAMGRMGHEGAWAAKPVAGKPVVFYMGDDSRNEYIYKYVSTAVWDPADATRRWPPATSTSTSASCMRRSSTPTAPATGSNCRWRTRPWPAMRTMPSPTPLTWP